MVVVLSALSTVSYAAYKCKARQKLHIICDLKTCNQTCIQCSRAAALVHQSMEHSEQQAGGAAEPAVLPSQPGELFF